MSEYKFYAWEQCADTKYRYKTILLMIHLVILLMTHLMSPSKLHLVSWNKQYKTMSCSF